jgi:hypothetical protein
MLLKSYPLLFILSCIIILNPIQADFAIYLQDNIPSGCDSCVAGSFDRAVLNIDSNFLANYMNLRNAGFIGEIDGFLTIQENARLNDSALCTQIAHTLPHNFTGTIWMSPQPTTFVLSQFTDTVQTCWEYGLNIGVNSNITDWDSQFEEASSPRLTSLPLWYESGDNNTNFGDFLDNAGFGGWLTPTMKSLNTALNPVLCYSPCNIQALIYY